MTDNEIIKALKCCASQDGNKTCEECPLKGHSAKTDGLWCDTIMIRGALALIKELTEENERLKGELGKEFTCFVGDPHKVELCPYLEEMEQIKANTVRKMQNELNDTKLKFGNEYYIFAENVNVIAQKILEE